MGSKVPARTKPELDAAARAHMTRLMSKPHRVRAYFQDPFVKYAA
jgi:hypothetical protein